MIAIRCKFVFFVGAAFPLTVNAPRDGSDELRGIAQDPRGWEVRFEAKLVGRRVTGSFQQPHDWGTFDLEEV